MRWVGACLGLHWVCQPFTVATLHGSGVPMEGSSLRDRNEKAYKPPEHSHGQSQRGYVASITSHANVAIESRSIARHMI